MPTHAGILEAGGSDRIQIQIVPKDRALLATKPGEEGGRWEGGRKGKTHTS